MRKLIVLAATAALFSCSKPATTPVEVSADDSTLTASPSEVVADGTSASDVSVLVKDTDGKTIPDATVVLTITGGAKADQDSAKTDGSGVANFKVTSTVVGTNTIAARVNDATALSQQATVTFTPAPATALSFRVQPSSAQERQPIAPAIVVDAKDVNGNIAADFAGTVTLTLTSTNGAVLGGTATAAAAGGAATFANLSVDRPGSYTLTASAPGLTSATSQSFTITIAAPTGLGFALQPQGQIAGTPIADFSVAFEDAAGNVLRGQTGDITVAIATGPNGATATGTLTVAAVDGVATFSGITFSRSGDYTLAATAASVTGDTSSVFTISAGSADRLAFGTQPAGGEVRSAMTVTVSVTDANGNVVTSSTAPVTLSLTGAGALLGTVTQSAVNGVATFAGISVTQEGAHTLTAASGTLMPATSTSFTVTDTTPPADPALTVSAKTQTTVSLAWTAVGDDGALGTATSQELRYSLSDIVSTADFNAATPVTVGAPAAAGTAETATVNGLVAATTYYFALRVVDSAGNASIDVISDTTAGCPTGYAGANCDQCAAGYRPNGMVCETYCTGTDPCNPAPANNCTGNTAVVYAATLTCTPSTTSPFYTCTAPTETDCSATSQFCLNAACVTAREPVAGDLVITEILHTSALGTMGQWFEVANVSGGYLNLAGLKVETVGTNGASFTLPTTPLLLADRGLFVFGAESDTTSNGGATVDFEYGTLAATLDLSSPKQLRLTAGTVTVTDLNYGTVTPSVGNDVAVQLSSAAVGTGGDQQSHYWCAATANSGKGTPKATNDTCNITLTPPIDYCVLQFPKIIGTVDAPQTIPVYAQFYEPSVTDRNPNGNDFFPGVKAELGFGPAPTTGTADPSTWTWIPASFNQSYVDSSATTDNDEVVTSLSLGAGGQITTGGDYVYGYRFRMVDAVTGTASADVYCDQNGVVATPSTSGTWGTATVYAASSQITAVRTAADGTVNLPITGARVTYVKPATLTPTASDPAGFFIQGEKNGPALFVAVDPTTLSPVPVAGDRVSFTVTTLATPGGIKQATAISGFSRISQGNAIAPLIQDVNAANDLLTNIGNYESELITTNVTLTGAFGGAGTGYVSAPVDTAGVAGTTTLRLRMPTTVQATLTDIGVGCVLTVTGPMWRLNSAQAQPSAFAASDLQFVSCPAPKVLSASGSAAVKVIISFDRVLDANTVLADGSQFSISPTLPVLGAQVTGPSEVTITTNAQASAVAYTVTVLSTVKDTRGTGVSATANTATFSGPSACIPSQIVISQVYGGGGNSGATFKNDFIELHNRSLSPVSVAGWGVHYASAGGSWSAAAGSTTVLPALTVIPAGGYFLIQQAAGTGSAPALPTADYAPTTGIAMGASAGKVILTSDGVPPSGAVCSASNIVDAVGYGPTASCGEGSPTSVALSSSTAAIRNANGCADTTNNNADFTVATPTPRNSASTAVDCNCN